MILCDRRPFGVGGVFGLGDADRWVYTKDMNNNEISPMDRLMNTIASGFTTGSGEWKPGVHIDGQKVASLPPRDGSCESDFIATETDLRDKECDLCRHRP